MVVVVVLWLRFSGGGVFLVVWWQSIKQPPSAAKPITQPGNQPTTESQPEPATSKHSQPPTDLCQMSETWLGGILPGSARMQSGIHVALQPIACVAAAVVFKAYKRYLFKARKGSSCRSCRRQMTALWNKKTTNHFLLCDFYLPTKKKQGDEHNSAQ